MVRVILLWTGPKNFCAGILKKFFQTNKICTSSKISNLFEPISVLSKTCPKFFLWTGPKNFCAGMFTIILNFFKTQILSEIILLKIFQQGESCDSLAFLDLKSWNVC
jgi:hypothetical protein